MGKVDKTPAIVVLSGGLDSCVTAAYAMAAGYNLAALHVNYGQRTETKELSAFSAIVDHYGIINRMVVDIGYLKEIGGSSLTDHTQKVEEGGVNKNDLPSTYVPFRNGNILSIAVSWGEVLNAHKIFIGAVEEDSSGYPDCRENFFQAFNKMLKAGLPDMSRLEVDAPLIHMKKSEIIELGMKLNAPLHLTWSCYQSETLACGVCDSCRLRLKGFSDLHITDPIKYR